MSADVPRLTFRNHVAKHHLVAKALKALKLQCGAILAVATLTWLGFPCSWSPVAATQGPSQQTPTAEEPSPPVGPPPVPRQVATMADLMSKVLYPASDAIFYIESRTPTNDEEWNRLQGQALIVGEWANLIMMPIYAWDQDQWMKDAKLMLDAGEAAYEAALAKDVPALVELNDALYQSCVTCHLHYRPDYGK